MQRLVEFELEDGGTVWMEITEPTSSGPLKAGGDDGDEPRKGGPFKKAFDQLRPAMEVVAEAFRQVNAPAEIGLEFSLKFNTKVGAFLFASADSEASFKATLKWKNEPTT